MGTCRALASARLAARGNVTVSLGTAIDSCRPRGTIAPVSVSCAAHTYPWAAADQAPVARGRNSSCHNHKSDGPHSERSPAVAAGGGLRGDPGLGPQRPRWGDVDARGRTQDTEGGGREYSRLCQHPHPRRHLSTGRLDTGHDFGLLLTLVLSGLVAPLAAEAQPRAKPPRADGASRLVRCRLTWRLRRVSRPGCVHGRLIDGVFMLSDGEQRLSPLLSPCEQQPCADIEQSHGAFPCAPAREAWRADALSWGHAPSHETA